MSKTKKKKSARTSLKEKSNNKKYIQIAAAVLAVAIILVYVFKPSPQITTQRNKQNMKYTSVYQFTKNGELTFQTANEEFITKIDIEIANTEAKREQGLMYRTEMKETQGMLFIFDDETYRSFWMKNTILPLDMIFVNSNYEIVNIRKNTTPYDVSQYTSTAPAKYVVEVNAGFCNKFNIKRGDKISFRIF